MALLFPWLAPALLIAAPAARVLAGAGVSEVLGVTEPTEPTGVAGVAGLAAITGERSAERTLAALRAFLGRIERSEPEGEGWTRAEAELRGLVGELERHAAAAPGVAPEMRAGLLDLAGYRLVGLPGAGGGAASVPVTSVRSAGRAALARALAAPGGKELVTWLHGDVLVRREHPLARRLAALDILRARGEPRLALALLTVTRDRADPLRPTALALLPDHPGGAVDRVLVQLLGEPHDRARDPHPFTLLLERVRERDEPLDERAAELLLQRLAAMLIGTDWREAARSIQLARGLGTDRALPLLLDGLSTWSRRTENGGGSLRIVHDLTRELRRRTGRSLGADPEAWRAWWIAVRQGRAPAPRDGEDPLAQRTRAEFFGLQPSSDRVVFVIDASGSMKHGWGTTGRSRYEEAVEQLVRYLQGTGEGTRFGVVLFSGEPIHTGERLRRADADTIERARRTLLEHEPTGGTHLRPAVLLALGAGEDGRVDPERLEADTVVVLCDGATAEGPGWVAPLLERIRAETQVAFHCALIGARSDGTLEALAEHSGGTFVRLGG